MKINVLGGVADTNIINIASVPHRSPFRYPGGKTWLVPQVRKWLHSLQDKPEEFIEPFAGGGIISLTVAFESLANRVTMIELDEQVASVWHTILSDDWEWLTKRISSFDLTYENVKNELSLTSTETRKIAFQTILKNRVYHGGILAAGSGLIKYGENGKGIRSRWYPTTLCRRIRDIAMIRDRIQFLESDGMNILQQTKDRKDVVYFVDPPYTAAGKKAGRRLYKHNELDHKALFDIMMSVAGDFLMTYDNAEEVISWAVKRNLDVLSIPMRNTHHIEMLELLIGRNLDWARPRADKNLYQSLTDCLHLELPYLSNSL